MEKDFTFRYPQEENPDWGHARNRMFVLKGTDSCWSSSLFSVRLGEFTLPNRDYPQQGFLLKTEGDYMKFLDAPMFKIMHKGDALHLEREDVELTPWKATYRYRSKNTDLKVTYYLSDSAVKNRAGGWIKFDIDSSLEDLDLVVSPVVDIRRIGEESSPMDDYEINTGEGFLGASRGENKIIFGPCDRTMVEGETEQWNYKLGNGYRKMEDGKVVFRSVDKKPVKVGALTYEITGNDTVKVAFACGKDIDRTDVEFFENTDMEQDKKHAQELLQRFKLPEDKMERKFLKSRILAHTKFSTREGGMEIPEAGEWWFKEIWFRDLLESLYHGMDFYRETKGDNWIKKMLTWTRIYIKDGLMASKVSKDDPVYNCIDGTLLYLLCAAKFYEKTGDSTFKKNMEKTFRSVLNSLGEDDGLVRCRPEYSWIDSVVDGRSTRIPEGWNVDKKDCFLLPEINALWIKVKEEYNRIYKGQENVKKSWNSFKETFWDSKRNFIHHIVYNDGEEELKDPRESSAAVVSLALLDDYFFGYEIIDAWKVIEKKLLVARRPVFFDDGYIPFGIITKNSKKKIYLGDEQYHEAVVWPRDSPYLFRILDKIGRYSTKKKIMKNMLDHQMSEGAIFYNHELFSLPEGRNPSETSSSQNPVPVKNPVQLWSQFLTEDLEVKEG